MNRASPATSSAPAVICERVYKSFGAVRALDGAELQVPRGRILGLLGENGAGKSTLVRLIAGELESDSGRVVVHGSVALVRQQLSTVPELTVLENVVFGAERAGAGGRIDWPDQRNRVTALAARTGLEVPLDRRAGDVPVALQQRAELLGGLLRGADILLLDEPTTYLTPNEVEGLFAVIQALACEGVSTVFISHKLREVAAHCDEVMVLRRGRTTARFQQRPFHLAAIGRSMTGGEALTPAPARSVAPVMRNVDEPQRLIAADGALRVAPGEVLGIAGVAGNGQDELVGTLSGIVTDSRYVPVILDGDDVSAASTWQRRQRGVRLIPANVKGAGTAATATLTENVLTAMVPERFRRFGFVRRRAAAWATKDLIAESGIVASGPAQLAAELSGGNLQRLAVARELTGDVRVLIAHEPTRGVDFAAAAAIHQRLRRFADGGGSVVLLTSDLDELLDLSDRVQVLYDVAAAFAARPPRDGRRAGPRRRRDVDPQAASLGDQPETGAEPPGHGAVPTLAAGGER